MYNLTKWNDFQGNNPLINLIKKYPDKEWNWYYISANPNITWKDIKENPSKPWDCECISSNPNITWNTIKNNPNYPLEKIWFFQSKYNN